MGMNFLAGASPKEHALFAKKASAAGHTTIQFLKKKKKPVKKMTAKQAELAMSSLKKKKVVTPMATAPVVGEGGA